MKRGILVLILVFLLVFSVVIYTTNNFIVGYHSHTGSIGGSDSTDSISKKSGSSGFEGSSTDQKSDTQLGLEITDDSLMSCEDYVYSNCPIRCAKVCIGVSLIDIEINSLNKNLYSFGISMLHCQDIRGSCITSPLDDGSEEAEFPENLCIDMDRDGYGVISSDFCEFLEVDCDDTNYYVNPGFFELCGDGLDNDCNGNPDEDDPSGCGYIDCVGSYFENDDCYTDWGISCLHGIGDEYCDDGSFGLNFLCEAYDFDGGDCDSVEDEEEDQPSLEDETNCLEDEFVDCEGECIPINFQYEWEGDGYCDEGTYGINLYCPEFGNDGGDCQCDMPSDCYMNWNPVDCSQGDEVQDVGPHICGYLDCVGNLFYDTQCIGEMGGGEKDADWTTAAGPGLIDITGGVSFQEFYEGQPDGGTILGKPSGRPWTMERDGANECLDWLNDGYCDDGSWGIDFNCEDWLFDGGDCYSGEGADGADYSEFSSDEDLVWGYVDFSDDLNMDEILGSNSDGWKQPDAIYEVIKQITSEMIINGELKLENNVIYTFEKTLTKDEFFELETMLFNSNQFNKGSIINNKLYISEVEVNGILTSFGSESHTLLVLDVGNFPNNYVEIEIRSDEISVLLEEGDTNYYDINGDGLYDIFLISEIVGSYVTLSVSVLYPDVSFSSDSVAQSGIVMMDENIRKLIFIVSVLLSLVALFFVLKIVLNKRK